MAQFNIVHNDELSQVLEVNSEHKLDLKLDNTGNVQFTKTAQGLKGDVTLPEQAQAPVAYSGSTIADNVITFTKTDGSSETLQLPATPVDIHLSNVGFGEDGALNLTLSNGETKTTNLTAAVVVKALTEAPEAEKAKLKTFLIDLLKGDEALNLAGQSRGFWLASA